MGCASFIDILFIDTYYALRTTADVFIRNIFAVERFLFKIF